MSIPKSTVGSGSVSDLKATGGSNSSVYIENLGCAKNQVDAEIMGARLEDAGWTWVDNPDEASLILINTCGFIEPAQQESIDTALAALDRHPGIPVALAGCLAQRFSAELAGDIPELAGVFGNREPDRIDEFVRRLMAGNVAGAVDEAVAGNVAGAVDGAVAGNVARAVDGAGTGPGASPLVWLPPGADDLAEPRRNRLLSHPGSVYLKVAEGCDHHCSFCAIPSIRGPQRVRSVDSIVNEFRHLRKEGLFEFNLVAQDLAAWRHGAGIMTLLETLLQEPGDFWLRPLYLYPDTFPLEIVELSRGDSRLLPYFDVSFQHGSPEILRRMGRPGGAERYLELIASIREINPDVVLRSSFIVGFPGETERHFEELLRFVETARLEWVGVFEFSPQAGTPAGESSRGAVSRALKRKRREQLEALQGPITTARLERFVGRSIPVLLEDSIQGTEIALGRSRMQAPEVDGLVVVHGAGAGGEAGPGFRGAAPARVVEARVTGVTGVDLQADYLRELSGVPGDGACANPGGS